MLLGEFLFFPTCFTINEMNDWLQAVKSHLLMAN